MLDFYKKTIGFGDLIADDQGMLSHQIPGTERTNALTITSKRVVLPTKEHLANPDWSNRMAFHPLVENQIGSESLIHERFRRSVNSAINLRFTYILFAIARICKDEFTEKRNKLGGHYSDIWSATTKADDKFYQKIESFIDSHPTFVHTVIHRGFKVDNTQYRVGCEVFFPVYEDLVNTKDRIINGINFRVSDIETFKNIYRLVFPNCDKPNSYTRGSDSTFSPSLFAQLSAINALYSRLNHIFTSFHEVTEDKDFIRDTSWISDAVVNSKELNDEAQPIGLLEGNSSKPKKNVKPAGSVIEINQNATGANYQNTQVVNSPPAGAPVQRTHVAQALPTPVAVAPYGAPARPVQPYGQPVASAPVQVSIPQPQPQPVKPAMTHHKIGMDPSQVNSATRTSSGTGFVQHRNIPTEHVASAQQNVMVMQTPQGPVAVQSMTMNEAAQLAQQQAQAQAQQQQAMMAMQQKAMQAQAMGYRVFQNNTGGYSVEVSDGKGGSIYQPIEQWEAPASPAGQPVNAGMPVVNMQAMMPVQPVMGMPGMVGMAGAQPTQVINPQQGGSVSINDWIRGNPVATANLQSQQMQQQLAMMQAYAGMMPGMNPAMMAGMNPAMMMGMNQNAAYVPTHMRVAAMMPAGMVRPVGS